MSICYVSPGFNKVALHFTLNQTFATNYIQLLTITDIYFLIWIVAEKSWWRHQIETFSAWLAICTGNSPASGEFPAQRPVTRSFDAFIDLCLNKRLRKQSWGWWLKTQSRPLWRHCNMLSLPRIVMFSSLHNGISAGETALKRIHVNTVNTVFQVIEIPL